MSKYKTLGIKTGEELKFNSYPAINKKYPYVTVSNLTYHFGKCKKKEAIIKGILIKKLR